MSSSRSALSAGGWDDTSKSYSYLVKQTGQIANRDQTPDPHIAVVTARVKNGNNQPLAGSSVTFRWDMPGPAPEETRTVTTDADGEAVVNVVSGDEVSNQPVVVRVEAQGVKREQTLDIVKAADNWSPIEVQPDLKGDPTIRITLTHDGLPVTGHPISWEVEKVVDAQGREVAPADYRHYAVLSGPLSTTNSRGEAVAYLRFGSRSGTIFYSAVDNVVFNLNTVPAAAGPVAQEAPTGGRLMAAANSRTRQTYKKPSDWLSEDEIRADRPVQTPSRVALNGTKKLFIVRSTFSFKYDPAEAAQSDVARVEVRNELFGDAPLEIEIPLKGNQAPTAKRAGEVVRLAAADANYYKTFATEFLKVLYDDYESGAALQRVACVIEGYGLAGVDFVKGSVEFSPIVLPYTIYKNRTEISKAIKVGINGVEFVASNRAEIQRQVQTNLSQMPKGIKNAAQDPAALVAKMSALTRKAGEFTAKGFDALTLYAANHPNDFARNTGYVAGNVSIAVAAKRMSVSKLRGVPGLNKIVGEKLLGRMPMQTASRLLAIQRQARVIINESDVKRFGPLVKQVLAKSRPVLQRGEMVAESETDRVIAASSESWTARLRLKLKPNNKTDAEPGRLIKFCFPAGTLMHMSNGSLRRIEQVKERDEVMSRDEKTGQNSKQKVTQLFRRVVKNTLKLRLSNGDVVEATPEHPFYVSGKGFRPAKVLAVGMALATLGQPVQVQAVERLSQEKTVYNFEVENTHTYFVGKSALWAHNQCKLTSQLKVTLKSLVHRPSVVKNRLSEADFVFAKKISSFRQGRNLIGETPNSQGTLAGIDGWWGIQGGPGVSLKRIGVDEKNAGSPFSVLREANRAWDSARRAGLKSVDVYIDAPAVDAKDLLGFIKPNAGLDKITSPNGSIERITIFCKNDLVVEMKN